MGKTLVYLYLQALWMIPATTTNAATIVNDGTGTPCNYWSQKNIKRVIPNNENSIIQLNDHQQKITTDFIKETCFPPVNLNYTPKQDGRKASLKWDKCPGTKKYEIQLRELGTKQWESRTSKKNSVEFSGIQIGKNYQWQVRAICRESQSNWSGAKFVGGGSSQQLSYFGSVSISPHPATTAKTPMAISYVFDASKSIAIADEENTVNLQVGHLDGPVILEQDLESISGKVDLDISNFHNGLYMLRLEYKGRALTKRFLVSN